MEVVMQEQQAAADARGSAKVVVQTADVRVVEYVLAPGDSHSWHYHSEVSDRFYCLEGAIGVDTREPARKIVLRPGESCEVVPRTVHHARNAGDGVSRYLLVQATGKYDYIRVE
ncbi:MAG: cupin domain-containing protein [Acetobacteraceae bacterium]